MTQPTAVRAASTVAPTSAIARRATAFTALRHPRSLWRLLTDRAAPKLPRVLAVLVVLYAVFPFDLVPDLLPVLGWLDDLGLVGAAVTYVASAAARYANDTPGVLPEAPVT